MAKLSIILLMILEGHSLPHILGQSEWWRLRELLQSIFNPCLSNHPVSLTKGIPHNFPLLGGPPMVMLFRLISWMVTSSRYSLRSSGQWTSTWHTVSSSNLLQTGILSQFGCLLLPKSCWRRQELCGNITIDLSQAFVTIANLPVYFTYKKKNIPVRKSSEAHFCSGLPTFAPV